MLRDFNCFQIYALSHHAGNSSFFYERSSSHQHGFSSLQAPYVYFFILTYNKVSLMSTFMILIIFRCECPFGFDGPRCQQVRHSFSGNGWAEYKTLPQCGNGSTTIEVLTTQSNGLVMYNGPRKNPGKKIY